MAVLLVAIIVAFLVVAPGASGYPFQICGTTGNFAASDTTYLASINSMAATLPRNASTSPGLYATAQAGQVWALALCRGDANATTCSSCLAQGFQDLPSACAYNKEATMYYDDCFLHYSNVSLSASDYAFSSAYPFFFSANATAEPGRFDRVVSALLNATADYAAYNSSKTTLYASGAVAFDQEIPEVYSWAQCTPDLTRARCQDCLALTIQGLGAPLYSVGSRILGIRCSIRYENKPFLDGPVMVRLSPGPGAPAPAPAPSLTPAPAPAPALVPSVVTPVAAVLGGRKYSVPGMVLIVGLPTLVAATLIAAFFISRRRQRSTTQEKEPYHSYSSEGHDSESVDSMMMDISTLRAATGDFAESNKLGEGGFGVVYKGTLPDGEEIAVKRLSRSSTQGVDELKNELALVAKLKHKNLVRLVGVCLEQQERLLIYEFVPNRSLDQILFIDIEKNRDELTWGQRLRIIRGIARGLQYLHEDSQLKVVHRDLKASNVLLDSDMNPKISDFGLARLFGRGQTQGVTNRVIGTYGYMAPEYVMGGNYSVKSDVFSFGVMVLEIVTGKKNSDTMQSKDLLTTMWEHWTSGTVLERMDPCMMNDNISESDVMRCIQVGLLCVQDNPVDRPVMSAVGMMLGSDMVSLRAPSKPNSGNGFSMSTVPMNNGPEEQST
uniref:Uncharacterized protein n=2 Tax=Avena sativa TaxID=4498 RepID=A0ACD5TL62_AVESA